MSSGVDGFLSTKTFAEQPRQEKTKSGMGFCDTVIPVSGNGLDIVTLLRRAWSCPHSGALPLGLQPNRNLGNERNFFPPFKY